MNLCKGSNKYINGFYVKEKHIAIYENRKLTKVVTGIINKRYAKVVIVFCNVNKKWIRNIYTLEKYIKKYSNKYLNILQVFNVYDEKIIEKETELYEKMMYQLEFINNNLFDTYINADVELEYLISLVNAYADISKVDLNVPFSIQSYNESKIFNHKKGFIYGGIPIFEDVLIEIEYLKIKKINITQKLKNRLIEMSFTRFMEIFSSFRFYVLEKKWLGRCKNELW